MQAVRLEVGDRVAGDQEDRDVGTVRGQPIREVATGHRGHHQIAHDEIDGAGLVLEVGEGRRAVGGLHDPIARCGERPGDEDANDFLVVDDEHSATRKLNRHGTFQWECNR